MCCWETLKPRGERGDALRERGAPDPHRFWNGEDVRGKRVIVRCLHGLGDTVQMLRYAPRLEQLAAQVTWEVAPRFLPLASSFAGVKRAITWGEAAPETAPEWHVQVEVMELPYLFRTAASDLPLATEYLHLTAEEMNAAAGLMGRRSKPRLGIVWSSGEWNQSRDLPYRCIERLIMDPRYEFWSLQTQPPVDAAKMRHQRSTVGDGLSALAATIANLDCVVTVDTLAAHLAGALGKRCLLLLQHAADWRWMNGRSDSPWYPSLTLIRQPSPGDWGTVIDHVQEQLASLNL